MQGVSFPASSLLSRHHCLLVVKTLFAELSGRRAAHPHGHSLLRHSLLRHASLRHSHGHSALVAVVGALRGVRVLVACEATLRVFSHKRRRVLAFAAGEVARRLVEALLVGVVGLGTESSLHLLGAGLLLLLLYGVASQTFGREGVLCGGRMGCGGRLLLAGSGLILRFHFIGMVYGLFVMVVGFELLFFIIKY